MNEELLLSLKDQVVKVDRGGASRIGKLLGVHDDHLVLLNEQDGVVYFSNQHIKSITNNVKEGLKFDLEVPLDLEFLQERFFQDVLSSHIHRWVKINHHGPDQIEGILEDVNEDFITVIVKEEIIYLSAFHIRSVSDGKKIERDKEDIENRENNQSNNSNNSSNRKKTSSFRRVN